MSTKPSLSLSPPFFLFETEKTESLTVYLEYIEYEKAHSTPDRVQLIYERALKDHALVDALWAAYTSYLVSPSLHAVFTSHSCSPVKNYSTYTEM